MSEEDQAYLYILRAKRGFLISEVLKNEQHDNHRAFTTLDEALNFLREFFGGEESKDPELCGAVYGGAAAASCCKHSGHDRNHIAYHPDFPRGHVVW